MATETHTIPAERLSHEVQEAMWAGNVTRLHVIARCGCCCDAHTGPNCPARLWWGCIGQITEDPYEQGQSWFRLYKERMTEAEFFGWESQR